jgi:hypothetical protein
MLALRSALAAGQNARLIRARNEDCDFPIKVKNSITDFRAYEFSVGLIKTRNGILSDERMPAFEKYLTLNYKNCYGTKEAVNRYYETGLLSKDNFKGIGVSHLVKVEDLVAFHACLPEEKGVNHKEYALMFASQYFGTTTGDEKHFYDHYRLKREHSIYTISRFKRKVWVVELLKDSQPKAKVPWAIRILNLMLFPLKFIPKKSVLRMDNYKVVTLRVGDVTNGVSVEFHIPKKFSFN